MKPRKVKHSGVAFEFGEEQLIVPPLTVGQVEALTPTLVEHDAVKIEGYGGVTARLKLRIKVIHEALKRNYPDIAEAEVSEFTTTGNSDLLMGAALGTDRTSPKIRDLGEAKPVEAA